MNVNVKKIRIAKKGEWDQVFCDCEYATYFQSREWAEILQCYNKDYFPSPYLLIFSDGARAIFPLTWCSSEQKYLASPAGTYGGLISLDAIDTRHFVAATESVLKTFGNIFMRISPFDRTIDATDTALPFQDDETLVLYLDNNFDTIFNKWSNNHKAAVKRALRDGVTIREATSLENWRDYYVMYKSTVERWGDKVSCRYYWLLFENMFNHNSKNMKLWLAFHEDRPIAGALCFYSKRHVVYWHGAAFGEYFNLKPMQLIFYEAIRDAAKNSYFWFDFNPSGGHKGVESFKKGFGTTPLSCPCMNFIGQSRSEAGGNNVRSIRPRFNRINRYFYYDLFRRIVRRG